MGRRVNAGNLAAHAVELNAEQRSQKFVITGGNTSVMASHVTNFTLF